MIGPRPSRGAKRPGVLSASTIAPKGGATRANSRSRSRSSWRSDSRKASGEATGKKQKAFAWMDSDEDSSADSEVGDVAGGIPSPDRTVPLDQAETLSQMAKLAPALEKRLIANEVRSKELCEVAAALGRTKYFDAGLFEQLSLRLRKAFQRQSFRMSEVLDILSSLAEVNAYSPELFKAGCQAIVEDLPRARDSDRQRMEAALKRVGHAPTEEMAAALRKPRGSDTREACPLFFRGQCKWGPKCKLSHDSASFDDTAKVGSWRPPSVSGGKSVGFNQSADLFKADRCGALW